ncbi:PREDICTED: uncharacterized protein LOC109205143 [Nicotiana attenuata]|uniref:uncharacterized protein LOC109205143 n=1 Tax=Nicotiana attenuata TaxID=49451 RepID=UPI000904B9CF|nr:PREDICTED: uncharacterized protein LOC109205143 [Nicotiana attenuata]
MQANTGLSPAVIFYTSVYLNDLFQAKSSIKVNGEGHGYFAGKRGFRQGDPISPLLFVLVIECLSRTLRTISRLPDFRFHPMCKGIKLTHLIFVDELMIFCKGNTSSVNRVMEALDHFNKVSGLIANMEKSSIFVAGVGDDIEDQLLRRTCFTAGTFPIKYLGLPLSPRKWNKMDCQMLIGKITHRTNVTYSNFWGNVFIIPQSMVKGVDKLCREYLWGKKEGQKKVALVVWDKGRYTLTPEGSYSITRSYLEIISRQQKLKVADLIWTAVAQPKHRFIGWLATLGMLLTKDRMIGMQLQVENISCNLCNEDTLESQDYLFVKCGWINAVRQELNLWLGQAVQITGIKQMLEHSKRKH